MCVMFIVVTFCISKVIDYFGSSNHATYGYYDYFNTSTVLNF